MNESPSVLLAAVDFFGQTVVAHDLAVVGLLVILEGVLSIDNALVLGLLAKRLPKHQQRRALAWGLWGAFIFRFAAVLTASYLLQWTFVKLLGGLYLVYIAVNHLFFESKDDEESEVALDEHGHPILLDAEPLVAVEEAPPVPPLTAQAPADRHKLFQDREDMWRFWRAVAVIELTDIAFAVDSILAAIALAGGRPEKLWVVITGGLLGMVLMRFAATIFIKLLDRFPRFEASAYLLVIVIGAKLLVDWGFNSDWSFRQQPWIASRLGQWQQPFERIEEGRRRLIDKYDAWLAENWIFATQHESHETSHEPAHHEADAIAAPHVPHLLNFHDLRFPECMTFWLLMLVCFAIGFVPQKRPQPGVQA